MRVILAATIPAQNLMHGGRTSLCHCVQTVYIGEI